MKIISSFCNRSGSNMYICGPDKGGPAAIIDPAPCTESVVRSLAAHHYDIAAVLVTSPSAALEHSIRTISRIYPVRVFAGCDRIGEIECVDAGGQSNIDVGDLSFSVIPVRPHSRFSIMYGIEEVFFTGLIIHAGTIGDTANEYAEELLVSLVKRTLGEHGEGSVLLPGVGPTTTLRAELNVNPYFRRQDGRARY